MFSVIKRLFDGAGEKLKNIIAISFLIEIFASIIGMIGFIGFVIDTGVYELVLLAPLLPIVSGLIFWITNIPLYAFAELVTNSYTDNNDTKEFTTHSEQAAPLEQIYPLSKRKICPKCGQESTNNRLCDNCGASLTTIANPKNKYTYNENITESKTSKNLCPYCGLENRIDRQRCSDCGALLK